MRVFNPSTGDVYNQDIVHKALDRLLDAVAVRESKGRLTQAQLLDWFSELLESGQDLPRHPLPDERGNVIARELCHRHSNELQILHGFMQRQARAYDVDGAACAGCMGRVTVIAMLERALEGASDTDHLDIGRYLARLAPVLKENYDPAGRIDFTWQTVPMVASGKTASALALIVNEALTNAVKHAFRGRECGRFRLTLSERDAGRARLTLSDDGPGLSPGKTPRMMRLLADRIPATFSQPDAGPGATFVLDFRV